MEFKVPFQYKYGYIRDEQPAGSASVDAELVFDTADEQLRMLWLIMPKAAECRNVEANDYCSFLVVDVHDVR